MSQFSDDEWHKNFRMSISTFIYIYICRKITPEIKKEDANFIKTINVEKRVAITMWHLATGSDYRTIGHLFSVAKGTVCVHNVCEAIKLKLMPKHIKWPKHEHLKAIVADFANNIGFLQCVGAIDETHIPIITPDTNAKDYYNRKDFIQC